MDSAFSHPAPESAAAAEARKRRRTLLLLRKIAVTILGLAIMAAGVAMLVAPGPGVLVIVLGLFVLSIEYEWAQRRFDQLKDKAVDAAHATADSKWQTGFAVLGALGLIAGGIVWGLMEDWPFSSWWTAGTLIGSGILAIGTLAWSVADLRRKRGRAGSPATG